MIMKKILIILFLCIALVTNAQHHMMYSNGVNLKENLVAVYDFLETSGTTAYDLYGGFNGSIVTTTIGDSSFVPNFATSYKFDGLNSIITTTLSTDGVKRSISFWMRPIGTQEGNNGRVIAKSNGTDVFYNSSEKSLNYSNVGWTGSGTWKWYSSFVNTGVKYHIVITYDASATTNNALCYVNGTLVSYTSKTSPTGTFTANSNIFYLGNASTPVRTFNGRLNQIAVWDDILNQQEVNALYNVGNGLPFIFW